MRRLFNKKTCIIFGILCCICLWICMGTESMAFTRTTGEVTGSSVKIRAEASTSAEVVSGVRAGDTLDVVNAIEGTDGKIWYKVLVSADVYGYIRSDFVTLATGTQSSTGSTTQTTTQTTTTPETEVTPMEPQNGHTSTSNVKVRAGASTSTAEVDRLDQSTIFSITGTAKDSQNKVWYEVSYLKNSKEIKGFIRSDLVKVLEEEPETPEEPTVEPDEPVVEPDNAVDPDAPTPTISYEAVYTTNENGEYIWYLYDRTAGQRYKINELLQVEQKEKEDIEALSKANLGLKVGLIISICLLVMMAVGVVFYLFKLREEEEVTYKKPASDYNKTRSAAGNTRTQTVSQTRSQSTARTQGEMTPRNQSTVKSQSAGTARSQSVIQNRSEAAQPAQGNARAAVKTPNVGEKPEKQKTSWKAKNFLEDNDEFEFGFLDFDDDDE